MKKFYAFVLIICVVSSVSAQINFFQDHATWGYTTTEHPDYMPHDYYIWQNQYTIDGDTVLNNTSYKKLYTIRRETEIDGHNLTVMHTTVSNGGPLFIRFDSSASRVYSFDQTGDQLMFDFNLTVGDTVPNSGIAIIDSIENISFFNNFPVRKYYIDADGMFDSTEYIIEGMGGSTGLFSIFAFGPPSTSGYFETRLNCFQLNNDVYPMNSIYSQNGCDIISQVSICYATPPKYFYPNPFQGNTHFSSTIDKPVELRIYDTMGRSVFSKTVDKENDLEISSPGILFWQTISGGKILAHGTILNEDH